MSSRRTREAGATRVGSRPTVPDVLVRAVLLVVRYPILLGLFVLGGAALGVLRLVGRSQVQDPLVTAGAVAVALAVCLVTWALTYRYVAVETGRSERGLRSRAALAVRRVPGLVVVNVVVTLAVSGLVAILAVVNKPLGFLLAGLPLVAAVAVHTALAIPGVVIDGNPVNALVYAWRDARDNRLFLFGLVVAVGTPVLVLESFMSAAHGTRYALFAAGDGVLVGLAHAALGIAYVELRDRA